MPKNEKQDWAEKHAGRLSSLFQKWQEPLGIDCQEYSKYLKEDLTDCYEKPLEKSLIESIS